MIHNDNIDIQKVRRQKICIYVIALAATLIFAVSIIILMCEYNIDHADEMIGVKYIYITAIVAYTVLPIAYFSTLWRLIKSMLELKE